MPVTPLHMGPALAVKGVLGRHFSLLVFGFSQVAIDIEPLVSILREDPVLHGFTHTYLGATLIGLFSVLAGRPLCQWLLRFFRPDERSPFLNWLHGPDTISWSATVVSALAGVYSHVFLDSIMHWDMKPFAPWSEANAQLHFIPVDALHFACAASGVAGAVLMGFVFLASRRREIDPRRAPGPPRPR
jgi:hypothetical protein